MTRRQGIFEGDVEEGGKAALALVVNGLSGGVEFGDGHTLVGYIRWGNVIATLTALAVPVGL